MGNFENVKRNRSFLDILTKLLFFVSILYLIFKNFNGALHHSFYLQIPQYLNNHDYLINDFYISNSTVINSSILYSIIDFFKLNLYGGITSFSIHFILSFIAIIYSFKLIRTFLSDNIYLSYLILFCLICSDYIIFSGVRSSPLFNHTLTPSHFAFSLMFPLIYFTLVQKWILVSILSTLSLLISIKVAWFPITTIYFFVVYLLLNKKINLSDKKLLFLSIPIFSCLIILINRETVYFTLNEKSLMFDFIIDRNREEDALHLNSFSRIISLISSFMIFYFFNKNTKDDNLKSFNFILLGSTIFMTIIGYFYLKYGNDLYPLPELVLLSPVRSLYLFQGMFVILLIKYCFKKNNLFFNSLLILYLLWLIYSFRVVNYSILCFLISSSLFIVIKLYYDLKTNPKALLLVTLLFTSVLLILKIILYPKNDFFIGEEKIYVNKEINLKLIEGSKTLKKYDDFPLLPIIKKTNKNNLNISLSEIDNRLCFFSKKSQYFGDGAHFYLDYKKQLEHNRRKKVVSSILKILNGELISEQNFSNLVCEDLIITGPKNTFQSMSHDLKISQISEDLFILPLGIYRDYF